MERICLKETNTKKNKWQSNTRWSNLAPDSSVSQVHPWTFLLCKSRKSLFLSLKLVWVAITWNWMSHDFFIILILLRTKDWVNHTSHFMAHYHHWFMQSPSHICLPSLSFSIPPCLWHSEMAVSDQPCWGEVHSAEQVHSLCLYCHDHFVR